MIDERETVFGKRRQRADVLGRRVFIISYVISSIDPSLSLSCPNTRIVPSQTANEQDVDH